MIISNFTRNIGRYLSSDSDSGGYKTIQKELDVFDSTGERTPRLKKVMDALETIPPTSVESERAFSAAGLFITKLRTRLSVKNIDALCFLRNYYKNN